MQTNILLDEKHALLMHQYIQTSQQDNFKLFSCEEPYNLYGERGFIDLILIKHDKNNKTCCWKICELKPTLLDLGETIRQINRAKQYFFKARTDLLNTSFSNIMEYPLILEANKANLSLCLKYLDLLKDIDIEFFSSDIKLAQQITSEFQIQKEISNIQRSS